MDNISDGGGEFGEWKPGGRPAASLCQTGADAAFAEATPRRAPLKLLFVCSRNRIRSLTAEKLLHGVPRYQVRSAGTQPDARVVITEGHIGWADVIFVMEKSHANRIRLRYPEATSEKLVIALHIQDEYEFMHPDLLDELRARLSPFLTLPE